MIGKKSEAKSRTFIALLLMSFAAIFLFSFAAAPSWIINSQGAFNLGTYDNVSINTSGIIKFIRELPNNDTGLIALYHFENWSDSSGSGNDLSVQGILQTSSNNSKDGMMSFYNNGSTQTRAYRGILNNYSGGNVDVTMMAWVYYLQDTGPTGSAIIAIGDGNNGRHFLLRGFSGAGWPGCGANGKFAAGIDSTTPGDDRHFCSISSTKKNEWQHVTASYNSTAGQLKFYINGVLEVTGNVGPLNLNRTLWVGGDMYSDNWVNGFIDEAAVWNRTLSVYEISSIYNRSVAIHGAYQSNVYDSVVLTGWKNASWIQDAPYKKELPNDQADEKAAGILGGANMTKNILLYHFDNNSAYGENSTYIYDFSGNGNRLNATCSGSTCPTWTSSGKLGGAYNLDGSDDYFTSEGDILIGKNINMTYETWFKLNPSASGDMTLMSALTGGGDFNLWLWINGPPYKIYHGVMSWCGGACGYTYGGSLDSDKWYHAVLAYDGDTKIVYAYLNGVLTNRTNCSMDFGGGTTNRKFRIGSCSSSCGGPGGSIRLFNGLIDEAVVYNRTLSRDEVWDHYKRGVLNLTMQVRSCDDAACSGETWIGPNNTSNSYFTNSTLANLALTNLSANRYFQYRFLFEAENNTITRFTPELFNVTVNYEYLQPTVTLTSYPNNTYINSSTAILNCSAIANSGNLTNITLYINSTGIWHANQTNLLNGTSNSTNFTIVLSDGSYIWNCEANSTAGLSNFASANYTFAVDTAIPFVNFTTPTDNDGVHVKRNYTYVNTTETDTNLASAFIDWNRSLVGYWGFNSQNANDLSTYGNNGTINGATWNQSGKNGGAYSFNHSNYIDLGQSTKIVDNLATVTIEAWIKPGATQLDYSRIFHKENILIAGIHSSNAVIFLAGPGVGWIDVFTSGFGSVANNVWSHVVWVKNSTNYKVYINGALSGEQNGVLATLGTNTAVHVDGHSIGGYPYADQSFNGMIDEVMIFNRALSPQEINASYNAGLYKLERNFTNLVDANYSYQAWVVDRAGNTNKTETRSVVIDTTAPIVSNITLKSNDTAEPDDIDSGDKVNVTVNITDVTGIDTVILQQKYNAYSSYENVTMSNNTFGGSIYNATFIPTIEGNWTYRIWANDTLGNEIYTNATNISADWEYTWTRTPTNFGTVSGLLETTRAIANITLNNTGDYALSFDITHNSPYSMTFSSRSFTLVPKESKIVEVTTTFGPVTREFDIVITIDATTAAADPSLTTTNFTLASYAGGPYFDVQIDVYPTIMNHSQNYNLSGYVKNLGNETATGTWLNWTLPTGFIVNSGNITLDISNLTAGSTSRNTLNITAPATLAPGAYTFYFASQCEQCSNTTCSNETYYINDSQSKVSSIVCYSVSDGTCGEGCTYESNASNYDPDCTAPVSTTTLISGGGGTMGGGGAAAITSEATFELVRGKDQGFSLVVNNPYKDATLTNLKVAVEGYLAQYITVEYPNNIAPGSSATLTIKIAAPAYFTKGIHNLTFIVNSIKEKGLIKESWSEKRYVTLAVHEISKIDSEKLLNETSSLIEEMKTANLGVKIVSKLLAQSQIALDSNDYEEIQRINDMIKKISQSAFDASNLISEIANKIASSEYMGINTPETSRLLELAKVAAEREDYALAFERAKEADLTYAVETKGEYNIAYFVARNSTEVFIGTLIALCLLFVLYLRARLTLVNIGLKNTYDNEDVLLGLMKETQKETFVENKRSMEEYNESMMQYENRLSNAVQKAIELETIRANLFRFRGERQRLEEERERLFELMKETQAKYLQGGMIESRIYQNKMHSFSLRLSEIEEKLALREAEAAIKKGKMPPILRRITIPKITLWKHEKEKIIEEEKPGIIFAKEKPVEIPKEEKKWVEELIEGKPETLRERIKKIKRYGHLDIPKVDNPFLVPFVKPEDLSKIKKKKG